MNHAPVTNAATVDDAALLDRLARGDGSALAEIARRHIDLVHAAARRQTRDAHLADDVTQAGFLTLTRKAGSIRKGTNLVGWLYMTTRNIALTARRAAMRRDKHEQAASVSPQVDSTENETILPLLDDAIHELPTADREAVLLRFFGKLPFADVGMRLGTSEEAARKRVTRAIEKLRARLTAHGATASVAALTTLLAAESAKAAPAATIASVTGTTSASATSLASAAAAASSSTKLVAAILILSGGIATTAAVLAQPATTKPSLPSPVAVAPTTLPTPGATSKATPTPEEAIAQIMRANEGPPPPDDQPWFPAFKTRYSLGAGEVVKVVRPPFIPERLSFYRWVNEEQFKAIPTGPAFLLVRSQLNRDHLSMTFARPGSGASIDRLLKVFCDLKPHEYALPDGVTSSDLPAGDWVCDTGVPLEQRLAALAKVIGDETGLSVAFAKREVEADAVVITASRVTPGFEMIQLETDAGPGIPPFQDSGYFARILEVVSTPTHWPIFDERPAAQKEDLQHMIRLKHSSSQPEIPTDGRAERGDVEALMKAIAEKVPFDFKIEKRKWTVWELTAK